MISIRSFDELLRGLDFVLFQPFRVFFFGNDLSVNHNLPVNNNSRMAQQRPVVLCLFLTGCVVFSVPTFSKTLATASSYIVSDIEVRSVLPNKAEAEEEMFNAAKEKAFLFVKLYLNKADLNIGDVDIDSLMISFTPLRIMASDRDYSGSFEVVFDRSAIDSLLTIIKLEKPRIGLYFRVSTTAGLLSWLSIRQKLLEKGIVPQVILIDTGYIDFKIFDQNAETVQRIFLSAGFVLVKNNSLYFLKHIEANDR